MTRLPAAPTRQLTISEGDAGAEQTAAEMVTLIRDGALTPRVRETAIGIVGGIPDELSQLLAIRDWVSRHFVFVRDPASGELLHGTDYMLAQIARGGVMCADCDDAAILAGALACAIGANVSLFLVAVGQPGISDDAPFSHVWASATPPVACTDRVTGRQVWIEFDVTRPAQFDALSVITRAKPIPVC